MTAYVFDAYGTLFDEHSAVARNIDAVGPAGPRLSEVWRNKQLEYSWVRALCGHYRDFWSLTEDALDFAFAAVPEANREARASLLDAYRTLDCYGEVPEALRRLREVGHKTAILSNGSPDMLASAIESAGMGNVLDDVFSIEAVQTFKTAREAYAIVTDAYGIEPNEVAFHSSNRWDIAGATAFGFRCTWVNRTGQPDEYGDLAPERVVADLRGLGRGD